MLVQNFSASAPCRRGIAPSCDPLPATNVTLTATPASIDGQILAVKTGDTIDVGIVWAAYLATCNGIIKSAAWALNAASPQPMVSAGNAIDQAGGQAILVVNTAANAINDIAYWDCTVTISLSNGLDYALPDRIVKRTIFVRCI